MRLRGYGNAIVPQAAALFIKAFDTAAGISDAPTAAGDDDTAMQARFLYRFGVDCITAQGLAERAALELRDTIMEATR